MRSLRLLFALPLLTLLGGLPTADAAPKAPKGTSAKEAPLPKIEATGIAEFDAVFMKAKTIHDTLDAEDKQLVEARKQVSIALGVAEDQPLKTAFDELKKRANGKLKVALKGKMPRLEATDAIPENVQTGIDAVNKLLDAGEHAIDTGTQLVPEAKALADACVAFPGQLAGMGLDPMKLMESSKKVGNNVKATGATPDRVDRLVKTSEGVFTDVKSTFGE
jgi:predicted HAD superfamily Cof-like phosphohydrolase